MARNKANALLHFVWMTYERRPLIDSEIERQVYRYIEGVCRNDKCTVLATGGMPDHVHLLVVMSHTISIADLLHHVKGGSSRLIAYSLKPGAFFQWQKHYRVFSVSPRDCDRVVAYIHHQKKHHAEGKLWPNVETDIWEADFPD